jgi:hypothetical protein
VIGYADKLAPDKMVNRSSSVVTFFCLRKRRTVHGTLLM